MKFSKPIHHRVKRLGQTLLISACVTSTVTSTLAIAGDSQAVSRSAPTRLPSVQAAVSSDAAGKPARLGKPAVQLTADRVSRVHNPAVELELPAIEETAREANRINRQIDWLRSGTSSSTNQVAKRILTQAHAEFRTGAWLSAETSAWESIRWSAESIDQNRREAGAASHAKMDELAITKMQIAKRAIMEARDFQQHAAGYDPASIARMADSHQTDVLDDQSTQGMSTTDASDRYLDYARVHLAFIASHSVEAAEALDLLAAIYLRRAEVRTLPSATALCLRRAALQGQPGNASLATNLGSHLMQVGLDGEARWALEHSLSIEPNERTAKILAKLLRETGNRDEAEEVIAAINQQKLANTDQAAIKIPEITQLTPDEFASLSKSVVWNGPASEANRVEAKAAGTQSAKASASPLALPRANDQQVNATLTSSRTEPSSTDGSVVNESNTGVVETIESPKPNPWQRLKVSWRRLTN